MQTKSITFAMSVFALLLLLLTPVRAAEPLVIGGLEAPPYVSLSEDGEPGGLVVELIRIALKDSGYTPEFRINNWARSFNLAKQGNIDALIPTIRSPDREAFFIYPDEPLVRLSMALLQNPQAPLGYQGTLQSIAGRNVGVIRSARITPKIDKALEDGTLVKSERASTGLLALALASQRVDAIAGEYLMMLWGAAQNDVSDHVELVKPLLSSVPVYMAFSRKSQAASRAGEISERLRQAKSTPDFQRVIARHSELLRDALHEDFIAGMFLEATLPDSLQPLIE